MGGKVECEGPHRGVSRKKLLQKFIAAHGSSYRNKVFSTQISLELLVIPPGLAHVHTMLSMAFRSPRVLSMFVATTGSVIFDAFIKLTGKADLYESTLR